MRNLVYLLTTFVSLTRTQPIGGIAEGVKLRILPFGDSITFGQASSDGNGYRLELYNQLSRSNRVDYLGSIEHGSMQKNRNEGHQGYDIEMIRQKGMPDLSQMPNIILLMLGTNNIVRNINREKAPELLSDLIGFLIKACPDAAILVATITPLHDPLFEEHRIEYNHALPDVIRRFSENGKHVALVDMDAVKKEHINDWDKVHPTNSGYKLIAQAWYQAIVGAGSKGWIVPPTEADTHSEQHIEQPAQPQHSEVGSDTELNSQRLIQSEPPVQIAAAANDEVQDQPSESFDRTAGILQENYSNDAAFSPKPSNSYSHLRESSESTILYFILCSLVLAIGYALRKHSRRGRLSKYESLSVQNLGGKLSTQ